jgi:hypothetical protein
MISLECDNYNYINVTLLVFHLGRASGLFRNVCCASSCYTETFRVNNLDYM